MRTSRIVTVLLALVPTAILGSPVPATKDGIIASDHGLTPSKTIIKYGLVNRDNHNPPTPTDIHPGEMSINAHATKIHIPSGQDNPNWNQDTKRPQLESSSILNARGRDDFNTGNGVNTDDDSWNCAYTSLRSYECVGGPYNETCIYDDGKQVACTSNDPDGKAKTKRDGGDPDFTCATDVTGDYVCTGADVQCVIGKHGDATCSFNGPDLSSDAGSKFMVHEQSLAAVLSKVAPGSQSGGSGEDDYDPFDANPNYSCVEVSAYTWSCGPNGKEIRLDAREVDGKVDNNIKIPDDEHYDPAQGCNQPQGSFGGCNGKREVGEAVSEILPPRDIDERDIRCVYITDINALPYPSGLGDCLFLSLDFLSPNNTLFIPDPDVHPPAANPDDFILYWSKNDTWCKHTAHNTCHLSVCGWKGAKLPRHELKKPIELLRDICVAEQQVGGYVDIEGRGVTLVMGALDTTEGIEQEIIDREHQTPGT